MEHTKDSFTRLLAIIKKLRAPEGCPWDREQNPDSLCPAFLEETYELIDAIGDRDNEHIKEELGDVFLLASMISYMKEQEGCFSISDVLDGISDKLVRRHPHVFGDSTISGTDEVLRQWEDIKVHVEGRKPKKSHLDAISKGLPPLERSYKLQKKAAKWGFDWQDAESVWEKVYEEIDEIQSVDPSNKDELSEEMGDLLFSVVNISRFSGIDPSRALHHCNAKFMKRFAYIEEAMEKKGLEMNQENFKAMDQFWEESKEK